MEKVRVIKNKTILIVFIILLNIILGTVVNAETGSDCTVSLTNISEIGNVLSIVSNENSKNTSITIENSVKILKNRGITVTSIKDSSQNNVDLNSTDLIGTGYKLITNNGEYTSIVYGDVTGDGQVNASDISIIIDYFLGTNTNISQASSIAGDVQQDEMLNSADISLMIDSFLGKLQGDILKKNNNSTEDFNNRMLSEVVKVGDYVNYPVTYQTAKGIEWLPENPNEEGWRVFKIENGKTYLVSNSTCFTVDLQQYSYYSNLCDDINNNFAQFAANNDTKYGSNAYLDTRYATLTRAFNYKDVETYLGINLQYGQNINGEFEKYNKDDLVNINQMYGLWKYEENGGEQYIFGVNFTDFRGIYCMRGFPFGLRTVVELKDSILTSGKDSNDVWQLK